MQDARVAENHTLFTEKAAAYTAWMDSESAYREAEARMTTAKSAVEYAQGEFDKYRTAVDAGEASYASTIAPMAAEKADLEMQQDMIAEIVKLITGMAQPSATKAVRAANLAQIEAKVSELSADKKMPKAMQQQALKIKKMTTVSVNARARTSSCAHVYVREMDVQRRGVGAIGKWLL